MGSPFIESKKSDYETGKVIDWLQNQTSALHWGKIDVVDEWI